MCLGSSYLGSSVLPIPGYVSFFRFEKCSAIISSNTSFIPCPLSSPSAIPIIYRMASSIASQCRSSHQCWSLSTLFVGKPAPVHLSQANFRPLQLPICPGTFQAVPRMKEPFLFQSSLPGEQVHPDSFFFFLFILPGYIADLPWSFLLYQLSSGTLW